MLRTQEDSDLGQTVQPFQPRQHMLGAKYEVYHYRDSRLDDVAVHHHDFYEVYFFLSGNVDYSIEGRNYRLLPGDVLLIGPMELHQPHIIQERQPYERMVLWMRRGYLESLSTPQASLSRCFDTSRPDHKNLLRLNPQKRQEVSALMEKLLAESGSDEYASGLLADATLVTLLVEINRIAAGTVDRHETLDKSSAVIAEILSYINDHYHEDLSLDGLASRFFISKYHLSHEFNRLVGTSVYRYIIQKRLVIARQMLAGGLAPTDVYQHCGFGDYANFYRAFKSEYHISPKEYLNCAAREQS